MGNFHHNRKRNSGLIYEFLVREMGSHMIEEDREGSRRAFKILERYFGPTALLAKEKELFDAIMSTRGATEMTARRVLGEVQRAARVMDHRSIDIKKSNLLKEIHVEFGKDFFSKYRLPEYRLFASIQIMLDSCHRRGRIVETVQKIKIEDGLVKYMISSEGIVPTFRMDREVDDLVLDIASKKFREKYGDSLTSGQATLLGSYSQAVATGDGSDIARRVEEDRSRFLKILVEAQGSSEISEDKVMGERLVEAVDRLRALDPSKIDDAAVEEMMLFHRLVEELNSDV